MLFAPGTTPTGLPGTPETPDPGDGLFKILLFRIWSSAEPPPKTPSSECAPCGEGVLCEPTGEGPPIPTTPPFPEFIPCGAPCVCPPP